MEPLFFFYFWHKITWSKKYEKPFYLILFVLQDLTVVACQMIQQLSVDMVSVLAILKPACLKSYINIGDTTHVEGATRHFSGRCGENGIGRVETLNLVDRKGIQERQTSDCLGRQEEDVRSDGHRSQAPTINSHCEVQSTSMKPVQNGISQKIYNLDADESMNGTERRDVETATERSSPSKKDAEDQRSVELSRTAPSREDNACSTCDSQTVGHFRLTATSIQVSNNNTDESNNASAHSIINGSSVGHDRLDSLDQDQPVGSKTANSSHHLYDCHKPWRSVLVMDAFIELWRDHFKCQIPARTFLCAKNAMLTERTTDPKVGRHLGVNIQEIYTGCLLKQRIHGIVRSHETIYCPLARDHAQDTIQPGKRQ